MLVHREFTPPHAFSMGFGLTRLYVQSFVVMTRYILSSYMHDTDHALYSSLTSGAFLLTFGKLADMFGRKVLFIIGMAGYTFSLLIAGFANNAIYMDVFSGIIGLFAAAVVPPAVGVLGATYEKPSKRKNLAFACFSAGNPLGFVGGMIVWCRSSSV